MKLSVDDETVEAPSQADLERLVPDRAPHEDWSLHLALDEDLALEADASEDGRYEVSYFEGTELIVGGRSVDGAELRQMLGKFLVGDAGWRGHMDWKAWQPSAATREALSGGSAASGLTGKALAIGAALVAIGLGLATLAQVPLPAVSLPFSLDLSLAGPILIFAGLCAAIVLAAAAAKLLEARRAGRWPRTTGRIVKSEAGFKRGRGPDSEASTNERIADIAYEYEVAGKTYRGSRVSLAEGVGEEEAAEQLARYPSGKVVAVFYDPSQPDNAVLERDIPASALLGCLVLLVLGVVGAIALVILVSEGPRLVTAALPNSIAMLVLLPGLGAIVLLAIAVPMLIGFRQARRWPKAMGRVTLSEVHDFDAVRSRRTPTLDHAGRRRQSFMPVIEYEYAVAGKTYRSRSVRLDTEIAGSLAFAEQRAARYPVGKLVRVRYQPGKPERAALEVKAGPGWLLVAIATALAAVALWASGEAFPPGPFVAK